MEAEETGAEPRAPRARHCAPMGSVKRVAGTGCCRPVQPGKTGARTARARRVAGLDPSTAPPAPTSAKTGPATPPAPYPQPAPPDKPDAHTPPARPGAVRVQGRAGSPGKWS